MSDEILRAFRWGTNARMIADAVHPLGYIIGRVLDATYGEKGGFWTVYQPDGLVTNDLNAATAEHRYDFRAFPDDLAGIFDTVVYDPPYKLNGTPAMRDMDNRFGTGERLNREQKIRMIVDGAVECYRITGRYLLVKCMDQVEGGRVRWVTEYVTSALVARGARKVDAFVFLTNPIPQPPRPCPDCRGVYERAATPDEIDAGYELGVWRCPTCIDGKVPCGQEHTRANFSTLLVFEKPKASRSRR